MPNRSLNVAETAGVGGEMDRIVNFRVTHKKTPVALLEAVTFKEPHGILEGICTLGYVRECIILQTCNRVEIYVVISGPNLVKAESEIAEYWRQRVGVNEEELYNALEKSFDSEALIHLLRLSSGLESMVVGEDQILGQVQDAFKEAKKCGTVGPILEAVFERAIKAGRKVRIRTGINKGAVSMGSVAVDLLEEALGDLKDKKVIIIGAGETGELMGKALAFRKHAVIFVANRTYERGVRLARRLDGQAVRFDKIGEFLSHVDAALVATSAPHCVLTKTLVEKALGKRRGKKLLIIDLSQPRNVEDGVANLANIELHNIDGMREIAEISLKTRLKEAKKAEKIVKNELKRLESALKRKRAEPVIASMCNRAEEIRRKELEKALKMLGKLDDDQRKVIEDLTRELIERILYHPIMNLRKAAVRGDINKILTAQELFHPS